MLVFRNNAETTLVGALTALDMDETRVDAVEVDAGAWLLFPIALPAYASEMHVTLSDPGSAPGVHEVATLVNMTNVSGTITMSLRRTRSADVNPSGPSWLSGASVSARVTAEMLQTFVQTTDDAAFGVNTVHSGTAYGQTKNIAFSSLPIVALREPASTAEGGWLPEAREFPAGAELVFKTHTVDVGLTPAHSDLESYYGGEIVVPSVADGYQYQFQKLGPDGNTAGAVTFPGNGESVEAYDAYEPTKLVGWWAAEAVPLGLTEPLPGSFFVLTEVGFLRRSRSGDPSTPAVVSIGTPSVPTKFADNVNLSDSMRLIVPAADSFAAGSLKFTVHSTANESVVGSFYYKGFVVERGL